MFTTTFYSFRGGVGRTMAVANVAYYLANQGKTVFLIDFDLEAPGLTLIPELQPAPQNQPSNADGLFGFLRKGLADEPLPSMESIAYECQLSTELRQEENDSGRIFVLPAGNADHYDLGRLRLSKLYENRARAVVIDALKIQIERTFSPDYLIVDSRTGLTESGGICTVHLPDLLVILSGLNRQNVEGTSVVLRKLRSLRDGLPSDTLFVISPVPTGEESLKEGRKKTAAESFSSALDITDKNHIQFSTIPYHPVLALSEDTFIARFPREPLGRAYEQLAQQIRYRNPEDLDFRFRYVLRELDSSMAQGFRSLKKLVKSPRAPAEAVSIYAQLLPSFDPASSPSAEELHKRAYHLQPSNPDIALRYAIYLEQNGRVTEAESWYRQSLRISASNPATLAYYADFLRQQRRHQEAESCYLQAIEAAPNESSLLEEYGIFLSDNGRIEQAEQFFQQAINADDTNATALANYAILLRDSDRLERAERYIRQAIDADPTDTEFRLTLADILARSERTDEADRAYQGLLQFDPGNNQVKSAYVSFLIDNRRLAEANEYVRELLKPSPDQAHVLGGMASALGEAGRIDEAAEYYRRALDANPDQPDLLGVYASYLAQQERSQDAEETFERALEIAPSHRNNLFLYGMFLFQHDRSNEAARCFKKLVDIVPDDADDADARAFYAACLVRVKKLEEAEHEVKLAIRADPNNETALHICSSLLVGRGEHEEALSYIKREVEISPDDGDVWRRYARQLWKTNRQEEAEEAFRRALAIDPENAGINGEYAWFVYLTHNDLERALSFARQAYELVDSAEDKDANKFIICNYAHLLLFSGQNTAAAERYEEALKLIEDENEFEQYCVTDLVEAKERFEESSEIDHMLGQLRTKWSELCKDRSELRHAAGNSS